MNPAPQDHSIDRVSAFYFSPVPHGFWRWSEAGDAAEWPDGEVIAFHEEIELVLRALTPFGLPPFGAVLLFLAACRDSWGSGASRCAYVWQYRDTLEQDRLANRLPERWGEALGDGLHAIHQLPAELRHPLAVKPVLAEQLFETGGEPDAVAPAILEAFTDGLVARCFARHAPERMLALQVAGATDPAQETTRFAAAVGALLGAFPKLSEPGLRNRIAAGIETLPDPADVVPVRPLIDQLCEDTDPDLRMIGEMARQLAGVTQLPKPPSAPDDLPLGGFSDVSNRGKLDRLLASELALDDLTLSVRIAMNEALYLRRESPPKAPARHRVLLVDNGIRLWGKPRLLATSVALAFAASSDEIETVSAFAPTAKSNSPEPFSLQDRDGVLKHLATVTAAIHPANPWAKLLAESRAAANADLVLITHSHAIEDSDFLAAGESFRDRHFHIATVDAEGRYTLWSVGIAGRREVASAELALDHESPKTTETELPEFYAMPETPLRISYPIASSLYENGRVVKCSHADVFAAVPRDGRLLYWDKPGAGARLLSSHDIPGRLAWLGIDGAVNPRWVGRLHIKSNGEKAGATLEMHDLNEATHSTRHLKLEVDLNLGIPIHSYESGGVLRLVWNDRVDAIALGDGRRVATMGDESITCGWGPFVRLGESFWCELHPSQGGFEYRHAGNDVGGFRAVWHVIGHSSLWGIEGEGGPCVIGPKTSAKHGGNGEVKAISADGRRIVVDRPGVRETYTMAFPGDFSCQTTRSSVLRLAEPDIAAASDSSPNVRQSFAAIGATADGMFYLRTGKGSYHRIWYGSGSFRLRNGKKPEGVAFTAFRDVENTPVHVGALNLRIARCPGGVSAFLDRNGFLHLVSGDSRLPEVSMVLVGEEKQIPIWTRAGSATESHRYFDGRIMVGEDLRQQVETIAREAAS